MQAGRELDAKVAEVLGLEEVQKNVWVRNGLPSFLPQFSTTWEGMGVLVEEAEKQGIYLEFEHFNKGRYQRRAWKFCEESDDWLKIRSIIVGAVPHAVSLSFLKVKGIGL